MSTVPTTIPSSGKSVQSQPTLTIPPKIRSGHKRLLLLADDIKSFKEDAKAATDSSDSDVRDFFLGNFRNLDKIFENFNAVWDELLELHSCHNTDSDFPSNDDTAIRRTVINGYKECYKIHLQLTRTHSTTTTSDTTMGISQIKHRKLPEINLPRFNGDLTTWPTFRDTFVSLVHDEPSLSSMDKYHYLRGSLGANVLSTLANIPLNADGYEQAWTALTIKFNNQRKLAAFYLNKILTFKTFSGKPTTSYYEEFISVVGENVHALQQLNIRNLGEYILFELVVSRLDSATREAYEINVAEESIQFPTATHLLAFIQSRSNSLGLANPSSGEHHTRASVSYSNAPNKHQTKTTHSPPKPRTSFLQTPDTKSQSPNVKKHKPTTSLTHTPSQSRSVKCFICSQGHILKHCPTFQDQTPLERFQHLKSWQGCKNCLHPGHNTNQCHSKISCKVCGRRHHTFLHLPKQPLPSTQPQVAVPLSSESGTSLTSNVATSSDVVLGTALARIKDVKENFRTVRLVVDCGSQYSFVSSSCIHQLGFHPSNFHQSISGIGLTKLKGVQGLINCSIFPLSNEVPLPVELVVVSTITTSLPQVPIPSEVREHYLHLPLADGDFWKPGPIDILLGADVFTNIITGPPVTILPNHPHVMDTIFGNVIIGSFSSNNESKCNTSLFISSAEDTSEIMKKFWEVEEVSHPISDSLEDSQCEEHFLSTHSRTETGRYIVSLPFSDTFSPGTDNKATALKRLYHVERRMAKDSYYKQRYQEFIQEYMNLGHMSLAKDPFSYHIPHHAVFKYDSNEPKIRVVFDGSSQTAGDSLNKHLLVGPKLQTDISNILLNFRRHRIAFTADIVKMYRQIIICEPDRKYQHIVWRFDPSHPVQVFSLNTVTYGLTCSPFLALRVIKQLVYDEGQHFPQASQVLLNDIYVDDIVTGSDSKTDAATLRDQLIDLLSRGGFQLSKWATNCPDVLDTSMNRARSPVSLTSSEDSSIKVLGIQWNPNEDTFSYRAGNIDTAIVTKRSILSTIARIFDPLGYISPVVFRAKLILQDIWQAGIDWDSPVPSNILQRWLSFIQDLPNISLIKIPRYIYSSSASRIIGFCDASERGYCAALYLVTTRNQTFLLKAKTKLAPIKPLSVPRLELLGALLLARLYASISSFQAHISLSYESLFFTDSTIVLGWLNTPPQNLKTFVAHRVVEITDTTSVLSWKHIRTDNNPADCGSRGLTPSELVHKNLWWCGPDGSYDCDRLVSDYSTTIDMSNLPELRLSKPVLGAVNTFPEFLSWMERFSSYASLVRSTAYLLRFINNCRSTMKSAGPITSGEFAKANLKCIFILQRHYYPDNATPSSLIKSLNLFTDEQGLLRVGGRIRHSSLSYSRKHPLLLPRRSHFNNLLIDYYHRIYLHVGPGTLQSLIQSTYWIPAARSLIRQRKFQCLKCYKISQTIKATYMGDLPPIRFSELRPFHQIGIDFAGPFLCRETGRRRSPIIKTYLCLFICLSTKAVHLEHVPNLSTEAFLDAFERFMARRGVPAKVLSDGGTNFVGASNYLKELYHWLSKQQTQEDLTNFSSQRNIDWEFNPPYSPHFGGLWETNIKVAKTLLVKTLGNQPYLKDELTTIFTKIEAILNSRPLTPLSSDPTDLQALTPAHFLIGQELTTLPEPPLTNQPENTLNRWQLLRQQVQHFWNRWRQEYLCTLQQRRKWTKEAPNLRIGDLVLLRETHVPPLQWPLARVSAVHPGRDGIVRVVTVLTTKGSYKRSIPKLIPLLPITSITPSHSN